MGDPARKLDEADELVRFVRSCPLFGSQTTQVIDRLINHSETRVYGAGEVILKEGDRNDFLHVLMSGSVFIRVDGATVAQMDRAGDLIGEMSVVTDRPCTATVVAETQVQLFRIRVGEIAALTGEEGRDLQTVLYRIYAVILADKLRVTNEKAKHYERISRQLEQARDSLAGAQENLQRQIAERTQELRDQMQKMVEANAELELQKEALVSSRRLMEDLARTRTSALERIAETYRTHVMVLRDLLEPVKNGTAISVRDLFALRREVDALAMEFAPLLSLYSEECAWRGQNLLIATRDRRRRIMATTALSGSGAGLFVASNIKDAKEMMVGTEFDIVCVGDDLPDVAVEAVANGRRPLVWAPALTEEVVERTRTAPPSHFFASNPRDRLFGVRTLVTTLGKMASGMLYGIERHLIVGSEVRATAIEGTAARHRILEELEGYLRGLGLRDTLIVRCQAVAEELVTNAIFDAPVDGDGRPAYQNVPRTQEVTLRPEEVSVFRYACDGSLIAISVEDPFGALTLPVILEYLAGGFAAQNMTREGKTGGGLGFFQMVGNADFIGFNVQPGRRTEAIALFKIDLDEESADSTAAFQYLTDFTPP